MFHIHRPKSIYIKTDVNREVDIINRAFQNKTRSMNKTLISGSLTSGFSRGGVAEASGLEELGCSFYSAIYQLHQYIPNHFMVWMIYG